MCNLLRCCVAALALLLSSTAAFAQDLASASTPVDQYEQMRKSTWLAGVLELHVPVTGYAYAGKWRKGLWPAGLYAVGLLMVAECGFKSESECTTDEIDTTYTGLMVIAASRVWGALGAAGIARAHNRELRNKLQVYFVPSSSGLHVHARIPL